MLQLSKRQYKGIEKQFNSEIRSRPIGMVCPLWTTADDFCHRTHFVRISNLVLTIQVGFLDLKNFLTISGVTKGGASKTLTLGGKSGKKK